MATKAPPTRVRVSDAALKRAASLMRVLAHPQRLRICELLAAGDVSVGDLAERLGLPQNAVSQHLAILRAHGVLEAKRDGKSVYYHVIHPSAEWMLTCIRRHAAELERPR